MSEHDESRRETLKILGGTRGTCAFPFSANELYGQQVPVTPPQHVHQRPGPPERPPVARGKVKPGYFTEPDFEIISRLSDIIIPATGTPGAVEAGVPAYIDSVVGANKQLQEIFKSGLVALDEKCRAAHGKPFLVLPADQQTALLTGWSEAAEKRKATGAGESFFQAAKNLTADGYYTSYTGLIQELGYQGNTVLSQFPESTIPEH